MARFKSYREWLREDPDGRKKGDTPTNRVLRYPMSIAFDIFPIKGFWTTLFLGPLLLLSGTLIVSLSVVTWPLAFIVLLFKWIANRQHARHIQSLHENQRNLPSEFQENQQEDKVSSKKNRTIIAQDKEKQTVVSAPSDPSTASGDRLIQSAKGEVDIGLRRAVHERFVHGRERAKTQLSMSPRVSVTLPDAAATKLEFAALTHALVEELSKIGTKESIFTALNSAGTQKDKLDIINDNRADLEESIRNLGFESTISNLLENMQIIIDRDQKSGEDVHVSENLQGEDIVLQNEDSSTHTDEEVNVPIPETNAPTTKFKDKFQHVTQNISTVEEHTTEDNRNGRNPTR